MLRIFYFAVFRAEFLSEFNRSGGAVFYALTARYALVFFYLSRIRASRHIGGVKQLRSTESVTDIDVTVTDSENLVLAVDVGNLMNKTVLFGVTQNLHGFVVGYIVTFAGFAAVVRHIAYSYTPVVAAVAAAFA